MISEIVLTFPSQQEMISFLEKQTKSKDETSQKVIQALAKVLADKSVSAAEIGDTITLTLGIVNVKSEKIDLTPTALLHSGLLVSKKLAQQSHLCSLAAFQAANCCSRFTQGVALGFKHRKPFRLIQGA